MQILITGASGYIGRQLAPALIARGHTVRALSRDPARAANVLTDGVHIMQGDVLEEKTLAPALAGIDVAYYLVHSMEGDGFDFEERDRRAALLFSRAAQAAGVRRIIYLGGLGDADGQLSAHLRSRQEVGALLASGAVPVTEFRAAIILGPGGTSFEMLRELTERLPMMICPRWVMSPIQPIALADVLTYLTECLNVPATEGRVFEIGGPEVLTYQALMQRFARIRGVRRWIIRVPVLTPRLSSYWVELVTSVPAVIARPLIEGLRSAVVVRDPAILSILPLELIPFDQAVRKALADKPAGGAAFVVDWISRVPGRLAGVVKQRFWPPVVTNEQQVRSAAPPRAIYRAIEAIGGPNGWYYWDWAWQLRGWLDRRLGGFGLDRLTALPATLTVGDRRDFWDVLEVVPDRRVRLRARMLLPGTAELEWVIAAPAEGSSRLYQTARFRPAGLAGYAYWYLLYPVHAFIFRGMARAIVRRATGERRTARTEAIDGEERKRLMPRG